MSATPAIGLSTKIISTGSPIEANSAVAWMVPVPGTPTVPSEATNAEPIITIYFVVEKGILSALIVKIASSTGQIAAQPGMPKVVPIEPAKDAVSVGTPMSSCSLILAGNVPKELCVVNAINHAGKNFFWNLNGFTLPIKLIIAVVVTKVWNKHAA